MDCLFRFCGLVVGLIAHGLFIYMVSQKKKTEFLIEITPEIFDLENQFRYFVKLEHVVTSPNKKHFLVS